MQSQRFEAKGGQPTRLAIVVSHPIQYFSPWFAYLAGLPELAIKVFYLWDFGMAERHDREFGVALKWDIPLLAGYDHEVVPNCSTDPGTHHFRGLDNPQLVGRVAEWRADAILLFGYAYVSHLRLLLSARLRHVPILLRGDSHNLGRRRNLRTRVSRLLRKLLFLRVDAFLAVGQANLTYFQQSSHPGSRVFIAPHFVDNQRFRSEGERLRGEALQWRERLGIPQHALVFGFAGKLDQKKRPLDLLVASEGLAREHAAGTGVTPAFLFVGSGQEEPGLRIRAGKRIGRDVFFAPFHNQSEMPRVYAAIDVLVLPSESETWGLCVNEAMNVAVPVIVSDRVGCGPDLVVSGETGWIFEAGNPQSLQRALGEALRQTPQQRRGMGEAACRRVAGYSVEAASVALLEAVDWVIAKRRGVDEALA